MLSLAMLKLEERDKELPELLQEAANNNHALLLSFIAPDKIVRKSPVFYDYASISVQDLYNIEKAVSEVEVQGLLPKKIHLVIQTPGGAASIAIKIAKFLQQKFTDIEAYVPYEAASGGTLLCLSAKTIVMDVTSNLTPIDPQLRYNSQIISATSYKQAIEDFQRDFGNQRPEEIPSPYQQMGNQFNPIILKEMEKNVFDILHVAHQLLLKSQQPVNEIDRNKLIGVVIALGKTNYPHSHIIDAEEAINIGLNISSDEDKLELLKLYKRWVSCRLDEAETTHIIDKYYPTKKQNGKEKK